MRSIRFLSAHEHLEKKGAHNDSRQPAAVVLVCFVFVFGFAAAPSQHYWIMASSRWKRFAFFDRHTLNLPSQVVEDLIPGDSINSSGRRVSNLLNNKEIPEISMAVNTAALPSRSGVVKNENTEQQEDQRPMAAMWSSLTACSSPQVDSDTIRMLSQHQQQQSGSSTVTTLSDGLVLLWVASPKTQYVHCLDITLRCCAMDSESDLDGWRGYFEGGDVGILDIATCRIEATGHSPLYVACLTEISVIIHLDPHLNLSCRLPVTQTTDPTTTMSLSTPWNEGQHGHACTMDMNCDGLLAIGTDMGYVLLFDFSGGSAITLKITIPPPPLGGIVTSLKLSGSSIFCAYQKGMGICCFEFSASGITARHDLDSRHVSSRSLTDYSQGNFLVARPDGLYTYSQQQKTGVSPVDGTKNAICAVPPPFTTRKNNKTVGSSYALVASTDTKSGRCVKCDCGSCYKNPLSHISSFLSLFFVSDAVDIYDATNKLVAFHVLLSPGHKALRAVGITTKPTRTSDGNVRGGRSTAVVFTSGGSIVSLTEKVTSEKISLLVQKNLYAAAISMAYADPAFQPADITALYRRHAEHLYRKGDYNAAMDQYIYTIGSLESAHVIFRYLDAPKIPMLAKYLEELRSRDMATPVHNELLRTCYLKLNDNEAAEKIAASASRTTDTASCSSLVSSLAHNPKEALATICTFEAPQAAEALVVHGAALARALPRETAGVVVSLCVGTYSPSALAAASGDEAAKMLEIGDDSRPRTCRPYPFHLFAPAFVESPKVLRLILAHCNRNKCPLTASLRRTLLELTLSEWNDAKRTGDTEAEKLRRKEAITVSIVICTIYAKSIIPNVFSSSCFQCRYRR